MCTMAITDFTVRAGDFIEESLVLGTLAPDDYTMTVSFGGSASATTDFTVDGSTTAATAVPDFELPDVNPNSPSLDENISPRDLMGQVSGWYFIKAT